jgi:hypothetical protein
MSLMLAWRKVAAEAAVPMKLRSSCGGSQYGGALALPRLQAR